MSKTITISKNKTLKLMNVLIQEISLEDNDNLNTIVLQMDNYIKSKGALPIGPLIQKTSYSINDDGEINFKMYLMHQLNKSINNIVSPFLYESVIRVGNCIYAHYEGPYEKLKLASDKINVIAFENEMILANENYTVFVNQKEDEVIADVFVEVKSHE